MKHLSALLIIAAILSTKSPAQITAALYHDLPADCWFSSNPVDSNIPSINKAETASVETVAVTVQNFSGNVSAKKVMLTWSVEDNKAGNYFEVQRSKDGKNFTACGLVFCSEKSGAEDYMFYESKQNAGTYYRLKMVSNDKGVTFSNPITITPQKEETNSRISILQNTAGNELTLNYNSLINEAQKITIYTTEGTAVYTTTVNFSKGMNSIHLNLEKTLKPGAYIAEVVNNSERNTTKFVTK